MCLTYQNPTQRAQNADPATCNARLPFSIPRRSVRRLVDMASSDQWQIRVVPAGHPATPQATLEVLAEDESFHVRSWVVRNMSTTMALLEVMSQDVHPGIAAYAKLRLNEVSEADG